MKKFLSAFLAVVMVLSMAATSLVTVFAAETADAGEHEVAIPSVEYEVLYYGDVMPEKWNPHVGTKYNGSYVPCLARNYAANEALGINIFNMWYGVAAGLPEVMNVKDADAFAIELYLSDASVVSGKTIQLELIQDSSFDSVETMYEGKLDDLVEGGLKNGWNAVKVPFSKMTKKIGNGADLSKIGHIRLRNIDTITTGADGLKVLVYNPRFMKGNDVFMTLPGGYVSNGWDKCATPITIGDNNAMGTTWTNTTVAGSYALFRNSNIQDLNASGMKNFEFDVYVSDISLVNQLLWLLEIKDENGETLTVDFKPADKAWHSGWNHVKWALADMANTDNNFDPAHIISFRLVNHNGNTIDVTGKTLTMAIENLRFTDDTNPECKNCLVSHEIAVPMWNDAAKGWNWALDLELNDTVSVSSTVSKPGKYGSTGAWYLEYAPGKDKGVDATGADAFVFDYYTSDAAAVKDVQVELELCSGGNCDDHEKRYLGTLGELVEGGMKNGWNTIVLPLSKMGDLDGRKIDWANVNYFRCYNLGDCTVGEKGLTMAVDNLRFTKNGEQTVVLSDVGADMNGWDAFKATPAIMNGVKVLTNSTKDGNFAAFDIYQHYTAATATDISHMKYLEFDFYVTDADPLKKVLLHIELNSSGDYDVAESGWDLNVEQLGLEDGWNHVKLSLADLSATTGNTANMMDLTNFMWFRIYNDAAVEGAGDITLTLANVRFTDDTNPECADCFDFHELVLPMYDLNTDWRDAWGELVPSLPMLDGKVGVVAHIMDKAPSAPYLGFAYSAKEAIDLTDYTYIEVDYYVSNVEAVKNLQFDFEISSSGEADVNEVCKRFTDLATIAKDGTLVEGWNVLRVKLDDIKDVTGGAFDKTHWNFFRTFVSAGASSVALDSFTAAIGELRFTNDDGSKSVVATGCDMQMNGWDSFKANPTEVYGYKALTNSTVGGNFAAYDIYQHYTASEGVNIVGMKYLEFDFYVTDADPLQKVLLHIELNSSGDYDVEESGWDLNVEQLGIKDGWNHIKLNLADLSATTGNTANMMDLTNFMWFRMYNDAAIEGAGDITFTLANVRITDDKAPECGFCKAEAEANKPVEPEKPFEPYVDENGNFIVSDGTDPAKKFYDSTSAGWSVGGRSEKKGGNTWGILDINGEKAVGEKMVGPMEDELFTSRLFYIAPTTFDVTNWQFVEIDVYVTEADVVNGKVLFFDLGSDGNLLSAELSRYTINVSGWVDGWNHIKVDLNALHVAVNPGANLEKFDFVRIYFSGTPENNPAASYKLAEGEEFIIAVDNLKFTEPKPEKPEGKHEIYEFEVDTEDEKKYLIQGSQFGLKDAGISADQERKYQGRFSDDGHGFKYVYTIKNTDNLISINWSAKFGAQVHIRVSADDKNWVDAVLWKDGDSMDATVRTVKVLDFLTAEQIKATGKVYLEFTDAKAGDGNGTKVYCEPKVKLDVEYTPLSDEELDAKEMTPSEHKVPLWGANKSWGAGFVVDNENQVAGSGCISLTMKTTTNTEVAQVKIDPAVNAKGMDTLEFDIYMSDLAILELLNKNNSQFEVTSSGTYDYQEKSLLLCNLMDILKAGNIQAGEWFHVVINLSAMKTQNKDDNAPAGEFNWEGVNFLRFYWTAVEVPADANYVLKFDNFVLTDAAAQAAAEEEAKKQEILEKNAALIEALEGLEEVYTATLTEENIAAMKAKVEAARAEYDKLTEEEKQLLVDEGYFTHLNKAEKVIKDYKPAEKPGDDKPGDDKPGDDKPGDDKPGDDKPGDDKPGDDKPGDDKPADDEKGCKSALTIGAGAMMLLAAAWVSMAARKKED